MPADDGVFLPMSSLPCCAPPPSPWELSRLVTGRSCVLRREGRESASENDGGWTRSDLIRGQISGQDGGSTRIDLKNEAGGQACVHVPPWLQAAITGTPSSSCGGVKFRSAISMAMNQSSSWFSGTPSSSCGGVKFRSAISTIKGNKREIIQPREAKDDILSAKEQFHHKLGTRDRFLILSSDGARRTGKQSRGEERRYW